MRRGGADREGEEEMTEGVPLTRFCGWHECNNNPMMPRPGETLWKFLHRETCSSPCGGKLGQWRAAQTREGTARIGRPAISTSWPLVTGVWPKQWERSKPFAAHNRDPGDGGFFHRPRVPQTQSYCGSSAALLVREVAAI